MKQKGYWDELRALEPGQNIYLPCKPGTAGGHACATLGKGNYRVRKQKDGARVWRKPVPETERDDRDY